MLSVVYVLYKSLRPSLLRYSPVMLNCIFCCSGIVLWSTFVILSMRIFVIIEIISRKVFRSVLPRYALKILYPFLYSSVFFTQYISHFGFVQLCFDSSSFLFIYFIFFSAFIIFFWVHSFAYYVIIFLFFKICVITCNCVNSFVKLFLVGFFFCFQPI